MRHINITFASSLAALVLLSACAGAPTAPRPAAKLKVVATFSVIGDFAATVGGDEIELSLLVPAGGDAHEFEPAPTDAAHIADAALLFENGVGLESWLDPLYASSRSKAARVIVSAGITLRGDEAPGGRDPHVWQDVTNAIVMVGNIERALISADPPNAAAYRANAVAYVARLQALDEEIAQAAETVPRERRKIVTSHDALGYFGARYGFEIVGEVINSLSTETGEPSAQEIVKLVDAIKAQQVKAIFLESMTSPKLVERVAAEAEVKIGGTLYTDALGEAGSGGATYIDAMRSNINTLIDALK